MVTTPPWWLATLLALSTGAYASALPLWDCEQSYTRWPGHLKLEVQGLQEEPQSRTLDYFQHLLSGVDVTVEAPEPVQLQVEKGGGVLPGLEAVIDFLPMSIAKSSRVQQLRPCLEEAGPRADGLFVATCRVSP